MKYPKQYVEFTWHRFFWSYWSIFENDSASGNLEPGIGGKQYCLDWLAWQKKLHDYYRPLVPFFSDDDETQAQPDDYFDIPYEDRC